MVYGLLSLPTLGLASGFLLAMDTSQVHVTPTISAFMLTVVSHGTGWDLE
jgi:hypothetical protein